jgi:hypothetical protein
MLQVHKSVKQYLYSQWKQRWMKQWCSDYINAALDQHLIHMMDNMKWDMSQRVVVIS